MAEYYGSEGSDRYAGEYNSTISYETDRSRVLLLADLTIIPDDGFCRVVEQSDMIRLIICDGVLVCNGQTAIMSLRDRTTKAPKQYLISGGDEKYSGWGTMAEFEPSVAGRRSQPSLHFVSARIERQSVSYLTEPVARISTLEAMYRAIFQPASKDLILRGLSEPIIRQSLLARLLAKFKRLSDGKEKQRNKKAKRMSPDKIQAEFLMAAERGDETALRKLFENGADINIADSETGLTALHLAVGRNAVKAARFLVSQGALFTPDKFGRLPTTIAAESEVSEELCDFIVEAEATAEARAKGV